MFQSFEPPEGGGPVAGRIAALRTALAGAGLDGMLVPRADAHQGESVPPSEERLAWLTGFTGSAGLAIVLGGRAALCVDGRYTLQAAGQTDTEAVEIVAMHDTRPEDWLREAVAEGARIGYDPWLHGRAEIDRLRTGAEAGGATLEPMAENPIDGLWQDRPARPRSALRIHPAELSGRAPGEKRAAVAADLAREGADAAVLTLPDSVAWLLDIRADDLAHVPVPLCFAILRADARVTLAATEDRIDSAVRAHLGEEVELVDPDAFGGALDALAGRTVRIDRTSCALWIADRLTAAGATPDWGQDPCLLPKARKTAAELEGMRAAHRRDGVAMLRFLHWIDRRAAAGKPPREIKIAEKLEKYRRDTGRLRDISFDTIVGAGPHGAIVHYRVNRDTNRRLAPGELLLVDSGGQYADGTTDVTRTVAFGDPAGGVRRPYTLVLKGLIAISTARWPTGLTGRDLDPLARAALWRAGLDYDHGTGHGVGAYLNVHEGPAGISRRSDRVALEPGMVLSNEPGCYREGAWGIRLENLVTVLPPSVPDGGERALLGFEDLTLVPFDTRLVDRTMLSPEETGWLDAYHARVREALTPDLPAETAAWLADRTAPLVP